MVNKELSIWHHTQFLDKRGSLPKLLNFRGSHILQLVP